ncbi:MAG: hypothetical protein LBR79_07180 [Oscillospiraceae bacterium]|nr:hypothetical protein [Oscillospiraceae bacterium]
MARNRNVVLFACFPPRRRGEKILSTTWYYLRFPLTDLRVGRYYQLI